MAKAKPEVRKSSKSNIGVIRYFQDTREELRKVTWPDREEITRLTLIVLSTTVAFAAFLGLLAGLLVGS